MMQTVPTEILSAIASHFENKRDVAAFARTCRQALDASRPWLYHSLDFGLSRVEFDDFISRYKERQQNISLTQIDLLDPSDPRRIRYDRTVKVLKSFISNADHVR